MSTLLLCAAALAAPPANAIIFVADDLGRSDLGCYGARDIKTPNIDALASRGVRFVNAYSTSSICSPARAGLMTGRHPARVGVLGNVASAPNSAGLPPEELTLAELLKPSGRRAGLIGKWHLGRRKDSLPTAQGFDDFFGFLTGCVDYYDHVHTFGDWTGHDLWRGESEVTEKDVYLTDLLTREATRFLSESRGKPFLLIVTYSAPHYPLQAPDEMFRVYRNLPAPRQVHAGMVSAMDNSIGRIVTRVRDLGLANRTMVLFTSDHGPSRERRAGGGGGSNAPHRGSKFSLLDGGLRVPFIAAWPGVIPEGRTHEQVVSHLDLAPTLLEAAAAPKPGDVTLDGVSLMPVLKENGVLNSRALFWKLDRGRAVREGKWKLILGPTGELEGNRVFLADLEADPGETTNLAATNPKEVERLSALIEKWELEVARRTPAK